MTTANLVTIIRIMLSPVLLFLPPRSISFAVIYLLCGVSDAADGWIARRTHTESALGAKLDSIADLMFLTVCMIQLLPALHLPLWIWIWTAAIAAVKVTGMLLRRVCGYPVMPPHSAANRLTGIFLLLLPVTLSFAELRDMAVIVVCAVAAVAAIEDLFIWKQ